MGRALPFWDRRIDLLAISQPTERHLAALPTIANRYEFDALMTNGDTGDTQIAQAAWQALDTPDLQTVIGQPGMKISIGDGVTLTVLRTLTASPVDSDIPDDPLVLMLTYGDLRLLLPGDLTQEAESALLNNHAVLDATVLHVPRSGHQSVTSVEFVTVVDPQVAVINVNVGNRFDLPHREVLDRLAAHEVMLYRTDQMGTIEIISDGTQMWVKTDR